MNEVAHISLPGTDIRLPVIHGSESERAIDISTLRDSTGFITLDSGYANTGSCTSAITYIDGDAGVLRYRGIPVEQFSNNANFAEVCWLLIFGKLPTLQEYAKFSALLTESASLDEGMKSQFSGFPRTASPMAVLSAMINALSCYHDEFNSNTDTPCFEYEAASLISKVRTLAAFAYRNSVGRPINYPNPALRYVDNFLHMMFSEPYTKYQCSDIVSKALNLVLILHADHEQNCSTSTVRMVGSSGANVYASCAAGVCALWGPLHGGANVAVVDMLEKIHAGKISPKEYVALAKDKKSDVKLMGFGHRVYKNFDPRATMLQSVAERLFEHIGGKDPLLDIARRLEEIALTDQYFIDRNLYPNVDFYSGIILKAIGIPMEMFTVIFAMGRMPGWIAHWYEQSQEPGSKISRPRQIYTGPGLSEYVSMDAR